MKIFPNKLISICVGIFYFSLSSSLLADWSNWRGPNFNGSASVGHRYPAEFSKTKKVKWSFPLNGASASTPIIIGDHIFLSGIDDKGTPESKKSLVAMCVSRSSGELVWSAIAGSGYRPGKEDGTFSQLDSRSNYSSPSPVASRNEVVFFYGNGDLVCFNHKVKEMEQEYTAGLWGLLFSMDFLCQSYSVE